MQKFFSVEPTNNLKLLPEEQFIINCLRSEFSGENDDDFVNFNFSNIDWNVVYEKSICWKTASLLYKIIKEKPSLLQHSGIPDNFLQQIKLAYLKACIVNETNFKNLFKVIEILHAAEIKVILLKGSHLAQFVYKGIGLRPMGDIDILIKKEDLDKAEKLLLQNGFKYSQLNQKVYSYFGIDQDVLKQTDLIRQYKKIHHHSHPFSNSKGIKHLEIHWTIADQNSPFDIAIEEIWKRAKRVKTNGTDMLVLSPEDLLLHLSLHISHNEKFKNHGLRPCCDIATIINHYSSGIDWNQLQSRACEWGVGKYLYLMLYLCKEILGLKIPNKLFDNLKPKPFSGKILLDAQNRILCHEKKKSIAPRIYKKFHSDISLSKKISYIFHEIFIPFNKLASRYSIPESSKRVYFYYFVRLILLLYRRSTHYASFFLYFLTHKKTDFYNYNLDTWLIPSDYKNTKKFN
ncbi:MAG: hypothetical protein A3H37_05815 [Candidatus Schekmanbacteria bacterium RIFCSPLOWO2_02_FULL_38_14]|uniref:Nucleotidyltransferase n=1 Tax=Candidatus Schekmanbacteria bacterium RIFCSPLOWO2_12_FULL_38_15 TaxID=1817883 RepID=A0A1F7SFJ6_9BACT|nr:MAG: hypothetical protein A3H37_05815 [Candidatus Schekmanbacteria bacterium RIFCSPLOWO2_02_FULL_38_14]OGL52563.1 MAG: hypothetical protein A3G31_11375 [Candidatus Schekmanbacteria bacterium RIFCSPLOWO2_12_FULL_38_15]